jgi:hypothetical protein
LQRLTTTCRERRNRSAVKPCDNGGMFTGGCACGALRYRAEGEPLMQGFCHCKSCQRTSGAGHVGWMCFPETAVTIEGERCGYTRRGGSGRPASRFACPKCHSVVWGTADVMPGRINLYAGSLDEPARFTPQIAIYVGERPPWDNVSRQLQCFDTVPTVVPSQEAADTRR